MAWVAPDHTPEAVLREDGCLTASVYRCRGSRGEYFVAEFRRYFEFGGVVRVTDLFRDEHLLPLARLAERARDRIAVLKTRPPPGGGEPQ